MTVIATARVVDCSIAEMSLAGVAYLAARFNVDVITQGPIDLRGVMVGLAAKVPAGATKRVHDYPVDDATPPCAIVGYPDDSIEFDMTMGRGSDRARFPVYFIVGRSHERSARDALSDILTGATGIKNAVDGDLEG